MSYFKTETKIPNRIYRAFGVKVTSHTIGNRVQFLLFFSECILVYLEIYALENFQGGLNFFSDGLSPPLTPPLI